jgi:5-methylcytosine-specific restriction endonuclease McrA
MDDSSCIPLKCCIKCGIEKPQTRIFFRPTRGGGFYPYCKECASIKVTKDPVPDGYKRCVTCKQEKPATSKFFRGANRGGFFPYCRECEPVARRNGSIPVGYKRCPACREVKPADEKFFHRLATSKDGLYGRCKQCRNVDEIEDPIPDGHKQCTSCNQIKPADTEHYHRWQGGLRSRCKECLNAEDREKSHQETLEKQAIRALDAPPPGMKKCSKCEEIKPATEKYFGKRSTKYVQSGLTGECKACTSKRAKEYVLKNADKVQWQKFMYKEANRDAIRRSGREYAKAHRSASNASGRVRRENIKRNGGDYTARDVLDQLDKQHGECYWCHQHLYEYHVDHVIPIVHGGSNGPENIVLACPFCNQSKGSKTVEEWLVYLKKFILPQKEA